MAQNKNRELTLLVTAAILLAFALIDCLTPYTLRSGSGRGSSKDWLIAASIAVCVAQVTLIAAWAVFAPGNFVVRFPWALLLGLTMWYILAWSQRHAYPYDRQGSFGSYAQDIADLGISLLLGVTVLQLPLWISKRFFRFRMLSPGEEAAPASSERLQFELKHLLIGTLFFAVALSPLRLIWPKEGLVHYRWQWELYIILGLAIIVNLVATLPCLWGGFLTNARAARLRVSGLFYVLITAGWLIYCLIVTGAELAVLCMINRGPLEMIREFCLFYLVNAAQCAVVFGVMRCYYALGYRLQRVPRHLPPDEPIVLALAQAEVAVEPMADPCPANGEIQ